MRLPGPARGVVLACGLICGSVCLPAAGAGDKAADPGRIAVAHSAALIVDATESDDALSLRIRHATDQTVIDSKDVVVAIDGKNQTVTHGADGSYSVPIDDLRGKDARTVEIIVGHDGIREVLDGKLAPPAARSAASVLGDHKQLAWWILNIAVVLAGAMALSRRKSF